MGLKYKIFFLKFPVWWEKIESGMIYGIRIWKIKTETHEKYLDTTFCYFHHRRVSKR